MKDRGTAVAPPPHGVTAEGREVPSFDAFVQRYQPERWMSVEAAKRRWLRMPEPERVEAYDGIAAVMADRKDRGWKRPDMQKYLRDKLWKGFSADGPKSKVAFFPVRSANWHRWREYRIATGQSIKFMDHYASTGGKQWSEPSEWPPALPEQKQSKEDRT